jgi:hypothetical protein
MKNNYINAYISHIPADPKDDRYKMYESNIQLFPGEAAFVYSQIYRSGSSLRDKYRLNDNTILKCYPIILNDNLK